MDSTLKLFDQRTPSDCLRCCVASITYLDYDEVPDFVAKHRDWYQAISDWAREKGFNTLQFHVLNNGEMLQHHLSDALWIATGPACRGYNHAVLCQGIRTIHDPHVSRLGLEKVTSAILFIPRGNIGVL